jgi:carbonic anhydrase
VDKVALGSLEYGAEHLNCPLLVVLGHEKCGAVNATCGVVESGGHAEGNIAEIVRRITPAVEAAKKKGAAGDRLPEAAADENIKHVISLLEKESAILKHLVHEKKLRVVGAKYHLGSGKVSILA